jgi:hypothetical protein
MIIFVCDASRVELRCSILGKGSSCFRRLSPYAGALVLTLTHSLSPLVEPDIGFSPVRLSDDLPHGFISNR